jgi:4a-hydroxytetrahydrobiopterin dehydratase
MEDPKMSEQLAQKTCTPCRGGIPPLTRDEAQAYMKQAPGWALSNDGSTISRDFKFNDFVQAMSFATRIGDLAEEEGHHPDIFFGWGYVRVSWQTHKIKGLHENDFIMAAKTNELVAAPC